jgi:hypothetical protein
MNKNLMNRVASFAVALLLATGCALMTTGCESGQEGASTAPDHPTGDHPSGDHPKGDHPE